MGKVNVVVAVRPLVALLVLAVFVIVGCATVKPMWVDKGSAAFEKGKEKVFYGVGTATTEIKDKALRIETADNRARASLQKIFDTYTAYLMKDYQGQDGVVVERAVKTFAAGNLSGVEITDHFTESDGTVYALAKLDLETFKKAMEMAKEVSATAKEYLQKKADTMFSELEKEEAKRK